MEQAKMLFLFAEIDHGAPLSRSFVKVRSIAFSILMVLRQGTLAKICSTVVERIVVAMVANFSFGAVQNHAMHAYKCSFPIWQLNVANRIKALRVAIPQSMPTPLREKFVITNIDGGDFVLREWDESVRLGSWLGNRGTLLCPSGHKSSAKGFVLPSYFTV
jgi:hypothetical protein